MNIRNIEKALLFVVKFNLSFQLLQATRPDMIRILSAALHVVLRRDMSLNRRLYAWLLGRFVFHSIDH